jgi:hypothetical protein
VSAIKGTSTRAVSVAEAKKSRSVSSSRIIAASDPVEPLRRSSRSANSRAKAAPPSLRSISIPAMSTK